MRPAKSMYVSPYQTELAPLRAMLEICTPHGLHIERDMQRGKYYRVVNGGEPVTEFMTLAKLELWMAGLKAGIEFITAKAK